VRARGSRKTVDASSKETPCLREFEAAFFSSHWKITTHIVAVKVGRAVAAQRPVSSVAPTRESNPASLKVLSPMRKHLAAAHVSASTAASC